MRFERVISEGTAHYSYLVGAGGQACVIDPCRDGRVYIYLAEKHGLKITHIFETHANEDYVQGALELSALTGAAVYHGPGPRWRFGATLGESQQFSIGSLKITAIYTPGHTGDSICLTLADLKSGAGDVMVFTGDTLFIGSVGRADLLGAAEAPVMASKLYHSLFGKLLTLGDEVLVFPSHGSGSVCGHRISDREYSTLGIEKRQNPALAVNSQEEFVSHRLAEKMEKPPYFEHVLELNLQGPPPIGPDRSPAPLTPVELTGLLTGGALLIDTREPAAFGLHIKGALSIWLAGLPEYAGWVVPYNTPLVLLLDDPDGLDKAVLYLGRLGYDHISGYLRGGIEAWYNAGLPVEHMPLLTVHELKARLEGKERLFILDVRSEEEWISGHIEGAHHCYVGYLGLKLSEVPADRPVVVVCSVGRRASLAASILLRSGYRCVYNVPGAMTAWKAAGYPVTRPGE